MVLCLTAEFLLVAAWVGDSFVLVMSAPLVDSGRAPPSLFLGAFCLGILVTFFLALMVHEAGHLLGGWLVGLTPQFASVGPFTFTHHLDGWRLGWDCRQPWFGGSALCVPEPANLEQEAVHIAAGPLANFVVLVIAAPLALASSPSLIGCWLGLFAVHSLYLGLVSLVPIRHRGLASDGLRLCQLLADRPSQAVR
jgi:hypothetical protein